MVLIYTDFLYIIAMLSSLATVWIPVFRFQIQSTWIEIKLETANSDFHIVAVRCHGRPLGIGESEFAGVDDFSLGTAIFHVSDGVVPPQAGGVVVGLIRELKRVTILCCGPIAYGVGVDIEGITSVAKHYHVAGLDGSSSGVALFVEMEIEVVVA